MRVLTFDVGGTFIKYGLVEEDILKHVSKVPTPQDTQKHFLDTIQSVINQFDYLDALAFSLPGVIDVDKKYIHLGGSLAYNNHTDAHDWQKRFDLPISIENDARCATLAEYHKGNLQHVKNGMVLTFGTGVGGGIILDGKLHKGSHLIAGEVSVVVSDFIDRVGSEKMLGKQGSVNHLIASISSALQLDTTDGKTVFASIKDNTKAQEIFASYCKDISLYLHMMQCLLDPEVICIGGGISENPLFVEGIQKAFDDFYKVFPFQFPHATIKGCRFHNEANLLGAYYHYKSEASHD